MATVYKNMNEDIKAFRVFRICNNKLIPAPDIVDIHSYDHSIFNLHHFIKAQSYKNRLQWYKDNNIEEILIEIPVLMHQHLEDPIHMLDDEEFFRRWGIRKELLLFNKKKWIEQQVKGENYGTEIMF